MRYLGLDYGNVRVGIAVSDENGKIAFPREVLRLEDVTPRLKKIIETERIGLIVIGLPRSMDGRKTPQTEEVENFTEQLKKEFFIPIEFEDEMLTTKIAKQHSSVEKVDASAAAVMLQSYLDRRISNFQ